MSYLDKFLQLLLARTRVIEVVKLFLSAVDSLFVDAAAGGCRTFTFSMAASIKTGDSSDFIVEFRCSRYRRFVAVEA